jgi:hypothetical protein
MDTKITSAALRVNFSALSAVKAFTAEIAEVSKNTKATTQLFN